MRKPIRHPRNGRVYLLALVCGALAALALPPLHIVPVLWLSLPVLILMIDAQERTRSAGWVGFWWGFGYHLVGLYWITEAILIEAERFWWLVPIAVPALSLFLAIFIAIPAMLVHRLAQGWPRVLGFAALFVLGEAARGVVLSGFPWNPLGSVWAFEIHTYGPVFLQPAAYGGVFLLTLLTVLVGGLPALGRWGWTAAVMLLGIWAADGALRLLPPLQAPPAGTPVAIVQGNVSQDRKWNPEERAGYFNRYLSMTSAAATARERPALVVWPETASPYLLDSDPEALRIITRAADGVPVLVGAIRFDANRRPRNSVQAIIRDAAGNGALAGIYDKSHLVPFGEYQPSWAKIGIQLVPGDGIAPGPGPSTLHVPGIPSVGVNVCYESIFPGAVVDRADRPDWMVNVTNDAWFGVSSGPYQHLAASRMRAVEEGLPLIRAANTGVSAAFDTKGRELGRLGLGVTGVLNVDIPAPDAPTWFARIGNLPVLGGMLAVFVLCLLPRRRSA